MTALRTALDAASADHLAHTEAMRAKLAAGSLLAPMPGSVVRLGVAGVGDAVAAGQPILWLEAMKMEHQVSAPVAGVLSALPVSVGSQVDVGTVLAVVEEAGAA